MAQHDYVIANDTAANVRADINSALQAIASNNSGATAPSTTYANQWWYDTSTDTLKIRSEANDAWISVAVLDQTTDQAFPIVGGTTVTSTGTELNLVDGSVAGTIVNSKAVIYGAAGQVNATTLQIAGTNITATAAELNFVSGVTSAIQTQLNAKANLASPTFTGTPAAPTAAVGTDTTQLATTAFVNAEISGDVGVANSALVKTALNASGSAPIYACRAWVNFDGTGTVAIRASGNVSSITDNATGDYTVNFTTAMPDANFSAIPSCGTTATRVITIVSSAAGSVRVKIVGSSTGTGSDESIVNVAIFR